MDPCDFPLGGGLGEFAGLAVRRRVNRPRALGCDSSERNGKISKHHIITTADTRGYNRAVMRLSGFGEASADEIIAGASEGQELPDRVPVTTTSMRKPEPLPPTTGEE